MSERNEGMWNLTLTDAEYKELVSIMKGRSQASSLIDGILGKEDTEAARFVKEANRKIQTPEAELRDAILMAVPVSDEEWRKNRPETGPSASQDRPQSTNGSDEGQETFLKPLEDESCQSFEIAIFPQGGSSVERLQNSIPVNRAEVIELFTRLLEIRKEKSDAECK